MGSPGAEARRWQAARAQRAYPLDVIDTLQDWAGVAVRLEKGDPLATVEMTKLIGGFLSQWGGQKHLSDGCADVIQEVLIAIIRAVEKEGIRDPKATAGFVKRVTHNKYVDEIRRRGIDLPLDENERPTPAPPEAVSPALRADLDRNLAKLPKQTREIVLLIHAAGLTYEEAAQQTGLPLGTVKRLRHDGQHALRRMMG